MCTLSVSNVIYHKFSHGAAFYTHNGKNVNVMLEFSLFSQDLYIEGVGMFEDQLQELVDLMTEKEIRVQIPVEELDILMAD